ncbi:MAG TPA: recombinase family protein [Pseudobacteroides sp.]|uniref:recombinase family protein n=1 Tax=Pseudobacteroides sp. TaxID=1968840 RepID=UPI002F93E33E
MSRKIVHNITPPQATALPQRLRVCAYVRVSTGHEKQLLSLENQTSYYKRVITANPEYQFCGIYSDSGISGAKENRPGFTAMLEAARNGEVDLVLTKSISRFARNTVLLLKTVREIKALGVGIIFEDQKINTLSSDGELMLTVLASIAEEERKAVSSNVKWSIRKCFERGNPMINTDRLLGYDKDKNGRLIINKEQAEVVRLIFKRYLEGVSGYRLAIELNKAEVSTYNNKQWSSHRILRIISNEKYMGACLMQKSFVNENGKQVMNYGQCDKFYIENHHPPIIDKGQWLMAQEIRNSRRKIYFPEKGGARCREK